MTTATISVGERILGTITHRDKRSIRHDDLSFIHDKKFDGPVRTTEGHYDGPCSELHETAPGTITVFEYKGEKITITHQPLPPEATSQHLSDQ